MRMSDVLTLVIAAEPNPWPMRAATSVPSEVERAQPTEATVNRARPPR